MCKKNVQDAVYAVSTLAVTHSSQESKIFTPKPSKCLVLCVATESPCSRAVAARRPSMLAKGFPCCCLMAVNVPQRPAIAFVTGRRFWANHPLRSPSSQCSISLRFLLGGRSSIPFRISPKVRTLVNSELGCAASIQRFTLGIGRSGATAKFGKDVRIKEETGHRSTGLE
jgi:hypothetical protein